MSCPRFFAGREFKCGGPGICKTCNAKLAEREKLLENLGNFGDAIIIDPDMIQDANETGDEDG